MAIKIITDSTVDMSKSMQEKLGVEVVPLKVIFGNEEYYDGVTITNEEFFKKLSQSEKLPSTSQVNPSEFYDVFKKHIDAKDQIIGIFISSKISGTYQSAKIAQEMLGSPDVYIIDSKYATLALGLLVNEISKRVTSGMGIEKIVQEIEGLIPRIQFYAIVDTLKYLKMGGRVNSVTALIGGIIGIHPIVTMINGEIKSIDRVRGKKGGIRFVKNKLAEGYDLNYPIALGHSDDKERFIVCRQEVQDAFPNSEILDFEIGAVIGTHGGPGCLGLAIIK